MTLDNSSPPPAPPGQDEREPITPELLAALVEESRQAGERFTARTRSMRDIPPAHWFFRMR